MDYLDLNNWPKIERSLNNSFELKVTPFLYLDGRNPRLPRKSSKHYRLVADTSFYFQQVFNKCNLKSTRSKYKVEIEVYCGVDGLGRADLDNYCKAILDGITSTGKVWIDDRQVDDLKISRVYVLDTSYICLKVIEVI